MIMQTEFPTDTAEPEDTTTKPAKRKRGKAERLTMEQVSERRMQEVLEQYRAIVARAANGEQLDMRTMEQAAELLERMALPSWCLDRDVRAQRDYDAASLAVQHARAQMPEAEARAAASTKRIKELEQELLTLRQQHHSDVIKLPSKITHNGQRCGELRAFHPHLFVDLAEAARLRIRERDKGRPMPAEPLGWSTT